METETEDTMRRCKQCGKILWEEVDENTVKIVGSSGQDYEVCFNYILATCKDCGRLNSEKSEISDTLQDVYLATNKPHRDVIAMQLQNYPYAMIPSYQRNIILRHLTEKQKEIFKILGEIQLPFHTSNPERINLMSEPIIKFVGDRMEISNEIIRRDIKVINDEIEKIKPDFLGRVTHIKNIPTT
jgi:hypothetical protein